MKDGALVQVLLRDDDLDDLLEEVLAQLLQRHGVVVLDGDDDGVAALGHGRPLDVAVLDRHLHNNQREKRFI